MADKIDMKDALIEIEAFACAAQFLMDTPGRRRIAGELMSIIEGTAKKAQVEEEK